jgi:phage N-6-adenine-methyltransferase
MSIVGFKATNHPQQVRDHGATDEIDDRGTHPNDFDPLNDRFHFTLDAAAADHNAKCARYFTRDDDGLVQSWARERVWCNPPFSDIGAWVRKAWTEQQRGPDRPEVIVMLLPANRTEQRWWQDLVEPFRDSARGGLHVEFLPGRMRFIRAGQTDVGPNERPPFGCCLLIWGDPGQSPTSTLFTP